MIRRYFCIDISHRFAKMNQSPCSIEENGLNGGRHVFSLEGLLISDSLKDIHLQAIFMLEFQSRSEGGPRPALLRLLEMPRFSFRAP